MKALMIMKLLYYTVYIGYIYNIYNIGLYILYFLLKRRMEKEKSKNHYQLLMTKTPVSK